jgi:hypothetical protein
VEDSRNRGSCERKRRMRRKAIRIRNQRYHNPGVVIARHARCSRKRDIPKLHVLTVGPDSIYGETETMETAPNASATSAQASESPSFNFLTSFHPSVGTAR